jgi:hypothetical protein
MVVVAAASIATTNGCVIGVTFKGDYTGNTTAMRYFIGQRSSANTTAETGRRGAFIDLAAGDTTWSLLHETSAGVQTKVSTGKAYVAGEYVRVSVEFVSATETRLTIATASSPTPVTVSSASGFSCTGNLAIGFMLQGTTASNRYVTPVRALIGWPSPSL